MEARLSMRSVGSTASKKRRSTKVVRYSVKALSQFILISAGVFLALACLGVSVQAYKYFRGNSASIFPKATPIKEHPSEGESLSSLAFAATITAIRLWGKLILSILIPTTEHSLVYAKEGWSALEPSLKQSALWFIYDTSISFKLGLFMTFVAIFCLWLLEREIKRRRVVERFQARVKVVTDKVAAVNNAIRNQYLRIRTEVERESRIAAQLLPHMLYILAVLASMLVFPDLTYQVSRGFAAWGIIVGWPVFASARRMLQYDEIHRNRLKKINPEDENLSSSSDDETSFEGEESERGSVDSAIRQQQSRTRKAEAYVETVVHYFRKRLLSDASLTTPSTTLGLSAETIDDYEPIVEWLRYWSVLSVCLFLEQFPLTGHFLSVVPVWPELRLAYALWLQLPVTRGCDLAFSVVVPLLDKYVKKIPALQMAQNQLGATVEQRGIIVTVLSSLGLVSKRTGNKLLKATEMNGTLIVVSIPFMLSPSFVTKIGVLVVGLAFPAHASTTAILEIEHFRRFLKKHDGADEDENANVEHPDAGDQAVFWLEYWVVYVLFSLLHAPLATVFGWWFPLWDQFHLAVLLWMQISYFSGAHNIFKIAVVVGRVWRRRRRAVARMRRRTSSVAGPTEKIEDLVNSVPFLSPLVGNVVKHVVDAPLEHQSLEDVDEDTDDETGQEGNGNKMIQDEQSVDLRGRDESLHRKSLVGSIRRDSDETIDRELNRHPSEDMLDESPGDSNEEKPSSDDANSSPPDDFVTVEAERDNVLEN